MPGQSMASLTTQLVAEELSNKELKKELKELRKEHAKDLRKQMGLEHEVFKLSFKLEKMIKRVNDKDKQIAEQNEELFELRTQVASLTDSLKRARCVCQGGSGVRRCKKRKVTDDSD